jgi:sodium-dependent dicarboxylate transporter 2/3/5
MSEKLSRGNVIGIIFALIFAVCTFVVPPETIGLDAMGMKTLGVLLITIALLISETMPTIITCFLCICLMYLFGAVPNMAGALSGFTNTTSFFVLVSFALSKAVTKVPLSNRLLVKMVMSFGKNADMILLAFMSTAAILSGFMANVATTAIFMAIALDFLKIYKDDGSRRSAGRSFMIGLAIAATIGGMLTPAGSSLNILALDLLQEHSGIRITFLQWMLCGIPITLVSVPFAWLLLTSVNVN